MKRLVLLKEREALSLVMFFISLSMLAMNVLAADFGVGIKVGDWVKYDAKMTGTPSLDINVTWMKVEFTGVNGTSIATCLTMRMQNGTEMNQTSTFDLATSSGSSGLLIPTNSKVGDTLQISGVNVIITGETARNYAGANRAVLSASFSQYGSNSTSYWDKQSGVAVEVSSVYISYSVSLVATETNIWSSGFLGLDWWLWATILLVIAVAIVVAVLTLRRRKRPAATLPKEVPPPPPPT